MCYGESEPGECGGCVTGVRRAGLSGLYGNWPPHLARPPENECIGPA